jgi:hypothetical protein
MRRIPPGPAIALLNRGGRVLGYHALAAGSVQKQETPERIVQGIANHPLGVILLARLAVDKSEHGNGLGKHSSAMRWPELLRQRMSPEVAACLFMRLMILPAGSTCISV